MLPIVVVIGTAILVLHLVSGSTSVKLPAMTPRRRREILDGRYEEVARTSRIQAVAASSARYGPLTEDQRDTYAATRERIERLRRAA